MEKIQYAVEEIVSKTFGINIPVVVTRTDEQFGDFATNVAMQLAGRLGRKPREIAEELVRELEMALPDELKEVTIAGPGFINLRLNDELLLRWAYDAPHTKPRTYENQVVVAEYSDPNPYKVLHAGHLYTSVVGYAISNLLEAAGGKVHRVNFGGDVGLHVGKALWAILQDLGGEKPENLPTDKTLDERASWLAQCYVRGTAAYEEDEAAKKEIIVLNKKVYQIHADNDHDSPLAKIYWAGRQWSYDFFDEFYERIGTPFEKYYPESSVVALGLKTVKEQLEKGVYQESNGAVIFDAEKYGLHARVFINSEGIPTYEAKDVGLIMQKYADYHFDHSVIITGNEQEQYMAVVLKSLEQFAPELARATTHLTHGIVKMKGGVKMSSRKGNILRATDVLDAAYEANKQTNGQEDEAVSQGAVKYAFLKVRVGGDIHYDPNESVSLEGNSGPYLMYAHARARSILSKVQHEQLATIVKLDPEERRLVNKITEYPEVLTKAVEEHMPHHVCTYLYELAQVFNRFYEKSRVIGSEREQQRVQLVRLYADVLRDGLTLLGISTPERL